MLINTGFGYKESTRGDRSGYREFKEKKTTIVPIYSLRDCNRIAV
jgi:hypothetical protein